MTIVYQMCVCYHIVMNHEQIIVSEDVLLVQLQPEQADRMFELTERNREYLEEFMPWPAHVKTVDDSRRHIEETIQRRADSISYAYGIEVDGTIVGDVSIRNLNDEVKAPEIGYWIAQDYAGRGLMTRAVRTLTDYSLNTLGLQKIIIRAELSNPGSNKVAEKVGYQKVGKDVEDGRTLNVWSISNTD